jgi:hypothetical protein
VKWFKRLFGKLSSPAEQKTPVTAAKPAATPAPAATETAKVETPATTKPVEQKEEPPPPAGSAINTLDRDIFDAAKPETAPEADEAPVEPEPAEEATETAPEAVAEPVAESPAAESPVAEEEEPAAADTVAEAVDAPAAGEEGPFGPGSAKPLPDGGAPGEEFTVKGKRSSKLFHTAESPYFGRTKADVWFKTPADAESAGFAAWNHKKKATADK